MCVQKCEVEVVETILLDTTDLSNHLSQRNCIFLPAGTLAKVKEVHSSLKTVQIRVYDFYNRSLAFENNLFACQVTNLHTIAPPLWPYLIGIREPSDRLTFFRNNELVAYLLTLQIEDMVLIHRDTVLPPSQRSSLIPVLLTCIIRYIGLISEVGPGFYLGVEVTVITRILF